MSYHTKTALLDQFVSDLPANETSPGWLPDGAVGDLTESPAQSCDAAPDGDDVNQRDQADVIDRHRPSLQQFTPPDWRALYANGQRSMELTPIAPVQTTSVPGVIEDHGLQPPIRAQQLVEARWCRQQEQRALAEQVLAHVLRTPELFIEAQQSITTRHFTSVDCWQLADVWTCAQKLVKEHGKDILKKDRWPLILEQELRRIGLGRKADALLFGDGQFDQGFFKRMMAMPASEFEDGRGRKLLTRFVAQGSLVVPFMKLMEELKFNPHADPEVFAEHASKILQVYREQGLSGRSMFMTPGDFAATEFKIEWLVPGVLVAHQPCIVGGPSKSLKTSIMIDLAVSIGAGNGTSFLGTFPVKNEGKRVGFISAESGGATIKETFERVCRVRGLKLAECNVYPEFRLPKLGQSKEVQHLANQIRRHGLQVITIDPAYLTLLNGNNKAKAPNLFDMGPLLAELTEACLEAGATPILVHHTVKHLSQEKENGMYLPLEREQLAQSGFAEFARQWMLINRRNPYQDSSGEHELWLRIGGSAGFGSLYGLDIKEGMIMEDFKGRDWFVSVHDKQHLDRMTATRKAEVKAQKDADKEHEVRTKLLEAIQMFPDGETMTAIEKAARISRNTSHAYIFRQLAAEGKIQPTKVTKKAGHSTRLEDGYKLTNPFLTSPAAAIQPPKLTDCGPTSTVL